jgi:hypothetical protein
MPVIYTRLGKIRHTHRETEAYVHTNMTDVEAARVLNDTYHIARQDKKALV